MATTQNRVLADFAKDVDSAAVGSFFVTGSDSDKTVARPIVQNDVTGFSGTVYDSASTLALVDSAFIRNKVGYASFSRTNVRSTFDSADFDLVPKTKKSKSLGSSSLKWKNVFVNKLSFGGSFIDENGVDGGDAKGITVPTDRTVADITVPTAGAALVTIDGTTYRSGQTASLSTTGALTFTPEADFTATVSLWGGAGGGADASGNMLGGRGGYVQADWTFTGGQLYTVWVAGGGQNGNFNTTGVKGGFGGGGQCGKTNNSSVGAASGGGLSGIFEGTATHANAKLIAGGGGGGGMAGDYYGGDGGSTTAETGYAQSGYNGGGGGTQAAGGSKSANAASYNAGASDGSALTGGQAASSLTSNYSGSGGGGGYYGGGGGGANNYSGRSGGGGSNYVHSSATNVTNTGLGGDNNYSSFAGSADANWNNTAGKPTTSYTAFDSAGGGLVVLVIQ